MFNKLKQIQELKRQAKELKDNLSQEKVFGSALKGKIQVEFSGDQEVKNITIDPSLLTPEKKEELEKGIVEATNKAIKEIQTIMARKIQGSGFKLPI